MTSDLRSERERERERANSYENNAISCCVYIYNMKMIAHSWKTLTYIRMRGTWIMFTLHKIYCVWSVTGNFVTHLICCHRRLRSFSPSTLSLLNWAKVFTLYEQFVWFKTKTNEYKTQSMFNLLKLNCLMFDRFGGGVVLMIWKLLCKRETHRWLCLAPINLNLIRCSVECFIKSLSRLETVKQPEFIEKFHKFPKKNTRLKHIHSQYADKNVNSDPNVNAIYHLPS